MKLDVRQYFNSITHQILLDHLNTIFKDEKLLAVFKFIISNYSNNNGKGIPIGNLTSQYFANHFLNKVDRFIKENLKVRYYVRYMDDMLLFNLNKEFAKRCEKEIREFLLSQLHLELKISQLNRIYVGIPFLGYRVFKHRMVLGPVARSRFVKKMKLYQQSHFAGVISEKSASEGSRALLAFAERADILCLKKKINFEYGSYL